MKLRHILVASVLVVSMSAAGDPSTRPDEFGGAGFRIEVDGVDAGRFTSMEGLSVELEVIEYQDGNDSLVRKRPGRLKFGDIVFKRDHLHPEDTNNWIEKAMLGKGDYTRNNVSIILEDKKGNEIERWNLINAFFRSWRVSSLDGKDNGVLTEEVVITLEWIEKA